MGLSFMPLAKQAILPSNSLSAMNAIGQSASNKRCWPCNKPGWTLPQNPILLDQSRYPQDVVVQSWLEGEVVQSPPDTEHDWQHLIAHFAAIHTLTLDLVSQPLKPAVLNCASPAAGKAIVPMADQPPATEERPAELSDLWKRLQTFRFPDWGESPERLVRGDPNTLNIIRRNGRWASVDWENSGWGDPAFEIADMMIHPAYITVPATRWNQVVDLYTQFVSDPSAGIRIRAYYCILSVWWVARLARFLYEIPRGLDQRLVERPAEWQPETQQKYNHYLNLAQSLMEH